MPSISTGLSSFGKNSVRVLWVFRPILLLHFTDKIGKIIRELATSGFSSDSSRMAKEPKQEPAQAPAPEVPEALGPPKSYRLYTTLGFVSLILFQVIVLWILLPPRVQNTDGPGLRIGGPYDINDVSPAPPGIGPTGKLPENQIGEDTTFKFQRTKNEETESIALIMYVRVLNANNSKFLAEYEDRKNTIIDGVLKMLRAATPEDFQDASGTALREKAKNTINNLLSKPYVQDVLITQLNYTKQ